MKVLHIFRCPICTRVSEEFSESCTVHTSFLSDFREEIESGDGGRLSVKAKELAPAVREMLSGNPYSMENAAALEKIGAVIRRIHELEAIDTKTCADKAEARRCTACIETCRRPGDFCRELLRSCGLGILELAEAAGADKAKDECMEPAEGFPF